MRRWTKSYLRAEESHTRVGNDGSFGGCQVVRQFSEVTEGGCLLTVCKQAKPFQIVMMCCRKAFYAISSCKSAQRHGKVLLDKDHGLCHAVWPTTG